MTELTGEHARVLCGAPYDGFHRLTYGDERLAWGLIRADLLMPDGDPHDCNCEHCVEPDGGYQLTAAGEVAVQLLTATPTGVEIHDAKPILRIVGGTA